MKTRASIFTSAALLVWHGLAPAEETSDEADRRPADQPDREEASVGTWEVGAMLKAQGVSRRPYEGDGSAGVGVREARLRFEAEIGD